MVRRKCGDGGWRKRRGAEAKCAGNKHRGGETSVDRNDEEANLKEEQKRREEPNLI